MERKNAQQQFEQLLDSALAIQDAQERIAFMLQHKEPIQERIDSNKNTKAEIAELFEIDTKYISLNFNNPPQPRPVIKSIVEQDPMNIRYD